MKDLKNKIDDIDEKVSNVNYLIVAIAGILVIIALVVGITGYNKGLLKSLFQNVIVEANDCPVGEPFELVYKSLVKGYTISYYRCVETDYMWYSFGDSTNIKELHQYINSDGGAVTYEEFCKDYGLSYKGM